MLGNAVVPQAGYAAFSGLLDRFPVQPSVQLIDGYPWGWGAVRTYGATKGTRYCHCNRKAVKNDSVFVMPNGEELCLAHAVADCVM